MHVSMPDKMSNEAQLAKHLEALITNILKKIVAKNPSMRLTLTPEKIKKLAEATSKVMMQKGFEFSRKDVIDENPAFILKLTRAITLAAKLDDKDDLFKEIKKIFDLKQIKAETLTLKNIADLQKEKILTPEEARKLALLLQKLQETIDAMEALQLIKKPPTHLPGAPKPKINPLVVELLGVLLEGQTGSIQPVLQQFNGNYFGVDDKNPNTGTDLSQVSQKNKIDSIFGDPVGLEHHTMENFEAVGCTFKELIHEVHAEIMRPKLTLK